MLVYFAFIFQSQTYITWACSAHRTSSIISTLLHSLCSVTERNSASKNRRYGTPWYYKYLGSDRYWLFTGYGFFYRATVQQKFCIDSFQS